MPEKNLYGGYMTNFRAWKIRFPYWHENYVYFGPKDKAVDYASKLKKKYKIPYGAKIREVHCLD